MDKISDYEVNSPRWLSLEDFEDEVWKTIEGCETHQISNYGRVKSLERRSKTRGNSTRLVKSRILRVGFYLGYLKVCLLLDGKTKFVSVHRLVAKAFLANPNNYPVINHKNETRHDNRAINLEWCTQKYNNNYGTGRSRSSMKRIENHGKRICQYTTDGKFVTKYLSVTVASRQNGYNPREIWKACKGKSYTYKGYVWRYEGDDFEKYKTKPNYSQENYPHGKPIVQYSLSGELIKVYEGGSREIQKEYASISSIRDCLNKKTHTAYGFIWRYFGEDAPQAISKKRKIVQYSLCYELIAVHNSLSEAADFVKSKNLTSISNCLHGRTMTACGYIWKYEDEGKPEFKRIEQLTMDGEHIETYKSIGDVLMAVGANKMSSVSQCINGKAHSAYGYKWRYINE